MESEVEVGNKGQITIPKKMRDDQHLKRKDILTVIQMPGGDIIFKKKIKKDPFDMIIDAIKQGKKEVPDFDAEEAWLEVEADRAKERS